MLFISCFIVSDAVTACDPDQLTPANALALNPAGLRRICTFGSYKGHAVGAEQLLTWDGILDSVAVLTAATNPLGAHSSIVAGLSPSRLRRQLGNVSNLIEDCSTRSTLSALKYCKFERLGDGGALRAYS